MQEGAFRTEAGVPVTAVTADEMRAVDRVAVEEVGIELLQMMENAGRTLAHHVREVGDHPVSVVAGNGGNGGGGLACARHLANRGVDVVVVLDRDPAELDGAAAQQYAILAEMGVPTRVGADEFADARQPGVVVDALVGYGLQGTLRGEARELVEAIAESSAPVVSLDVPSGRDATTGDVLGATVAPDRIVTLALPKTGLLDVSAHLVLADISVPATVYDRLDIPYAPPFDQSYWTTLRD